MQILKLEIKYHITELSKKLARACGILFKIRYLLPSSILIILYNALFLSFEQCGIIFWGQTFASYLEPLFKLQKELSEQSLVKLFLHIPFQSSKI